MRKFSALVLFFIVTSFCGFSQETDSTFLGISLYSCADYVSHNFLTVGLWLYLTYILTDDEIYGYYYKHIYLVKNPKPAL